MIRMIFPDGVAHVITSSEPVTIGIVRTTAKGLVYETTGYMATHARPATVEELSEWTKR